MGSIASIIEHAGVQTYRGRYLMIDRVVSEGPMGVLFGGRRRQLVIQVKFVKMPRDGDGVSVYVCACARVLGWDGVCVRACR